ncbi:MAG: RNA polymerase subunit sigma-70 [Isosphaera sp.]|nr:RNA polymerase subunit sigma-70 [Isosphaera sp.]
MDGPDDDAEATVARITAAQRPLAAYVRTLVAPWGNPDDVLQEVNLVLWRKAAEFDGRGEFLTWACRVAYLQVLAHRKKLRRDRTVPFDDAILADLAGPVAEKVAEVDDRLDALRRCLGTLSPDARRLVAARYADGGSVGAAAAEAGRTPESVRVSLHRIRKALLNCVRKRLSGGVP